MVSRDGPIGRPVPVDPRITACAYRLLEPEAASRVCLVLANAFLPTPAMLLAVVHSPRDAFLGAIRALLNPVLIARGSPNPPWLDDTLRDVFRVRCRLACADGVVAPPPPLAPPRPVSRPAIRLVRDVVPSARPPVARCPVPAVSPLGRRRLGLLSHRPVVATDRSRVTRVSVFRRSLRPRLPDPIVPVGAAPPIPVVSAGRGQVRPRYVPRHLYMAGVRPPPLVTPLPLSRTGL